VVAIAAAAPARARSTSFYALMAAACLAVAVLGFAPTYWLPLADITAFAVLVALAIANVARPEVHNRLMLCATVTMLGGPA
jgi:hypothetical protein